MIDSEVSEDKYLEPYQGEFFPKSKKPSGKKSPWGKSRGQVHGYYRTPFDTMSKPNWMKEPEGEIRIEYLEEE